MSLRTAHTKWGRVHNRLILSCVIINYIIGFVIMVALIKIWVVAVP